MLEKRQFFSLRLPLTSTTRLIFDAGLSTQNDGFQIIILIKLFLVSYALRGEIPFLVFSRVAKGLFCIAGPRTREGEDLQG